jgi:hypothetical protein
MIEIFQLSFRSVSATVETKREQVRRILQLPPSSSPHEMEPAARELETALTAYLRRATETFDLSKNVEVSHIQSRHLLRDCYWLHAITLRWENFPSTVCSPSGWQF